MMIDNVVVLQGKKDGICRKAVLATLVTLLFVTLFVTPLQGQDGLHAKLIASADRKPAAALDLAGEDGTIAHLGDFKGKVVLLNFWATGCGGCALEIPSLVEIQNTNKGEAFTVIGVSLDILYEHLKDANEAWARVKPFVPSHAMNYPILMGNDSIIEAYGIKTVPASYLVDKDGKVAAVYVGVVSKDDVESNVKQLLAGN